MGFYLRKGINLGLLRLNISKSGIGVSFGVKGLRIGSGPSGNYVHVGRKGIYYKKKLSNGGRKYSVWLILLVVLLIVLDLFIYFIAKIDWKEFRMFILE